MGRPRSTVSPAATVSSARYDTETFRLPFRIVAVRMPATTPAYATRPPIGARTRDPGAAARSTPQ